MLGDEREGVFAVGGGCHELDPVEQAEQGSEAFAVVQATMMPLYSISGVWIPTDQLGGGLRTVASIFPVEHLAATLHLASVRGSFTSALSPTDLLVLLGWALAAALLAARRFSWLPNAATA